jgi:hypothetical protein
MEKIGEWSSFACKNAEYSRRNTKDQLTPSLLPLLLYPSPERSGVPSLLFSEVATENS